MLCVEFDMGLFAGYVMCSLPVSTFVLVASFCLLASHPFAWVGMVHG